LFYWAFACLVGCRLTQTAITADPSNATCYSNRAAAYMSLNRFYNALEDVKRADELEPGNAKVLHRLARIYTSLGRPQEAADVYPSIQPPPSAKETAPATTMLQHLRQAETHLRESTSGSMVIHALNQAARGLGLGCQWPRRWLLMRGEAYLKMGNANAVGDAQAVAMQLLRMNSQDPDALVLRGRALYALGDNSKALDHFRSALTCDPDFREAVKHLRMVQKLERLKSEGNELFKTGKIKEAVEQYTQALDVDRSNKPTNAKILQNRAMCYIKVCPPNECSDRSITLRS
jgi:DnaJ homolog subfamily C member 7